MRYPKEFFRSLFLCTVAVLAVLAIAGCGTSKVAVQPSLASKSDVIVNQRVEVSPLTIMVRSESAPPNEISALFIPFRVQQRMENPRIMGREIMRVFWSTWLSRSVFSTMAFDETMVYASPEDAVRHARNRGAQLAVLGDVTYLMAGGTQGDTALSLRLNIYDTATGALIWSMEQAGRMQAELTQDYILAAKRTRMPADPLQAVAVTLAQNMAQPLRVWILGPEAAKE